MKLETPITEKIEITDAEQVVVFFALRDRIAERRKAMENEKDPRTRCYISHELATMEVFKDKLCKIMGI